MPTLEQWAAELVGNHRKFDNFGWHERPDDDQNFGIVNMTNRDADLCTESNWHAAQELLKEFLDADTDDPDIWIERHSHWAVGWVEAFIVRVYDANGEITPAARVLYEIAQRFEDYPLLDEMDYCEREYNSQIEAIRQVCLLHSERADELPDGWAEQVWDLLREDYGRYPFDGYDGGVDGEVCEEAMIELGFAIADDEEDDD